MTVRGYRFGAADVEVPPLRDHVVVAYRRGTTIRRGVGGIWTTGTPGPGAVSLLTRAVASRWVWPDDIEVVHVYLPADVLARACRDMYDRDVRDVTLRDEVQADDPAIHRTALMLAQEAELGGPGCGLLVDALACQLAVLLVRAHADVVFDEPAGAGLTSAQERTVRDHVEEHLHERITLDDLATVAGLSRCRFLRRFRRSTGTSPHDFVLDRRVARAQVLARRTGMPLLGHRTEVRVRRPEPPDPGVPRAGGHAAGPVPRLRLMHRPGGVSSRRGTGAAAGCSRRRTPSSPPSPPPRSSG